MKKEKIHIYVFTHENEGDKFHIRVSNERLEAKLHKFAALGSKRGLTKRISEKAEPFLKLNTILRRTIKFFNDLTAVLTFIS